MRVAQSFVPAIQNSRHAATFSRSSTRSNVTTGLSLRPELCYILPMTRADIIAALKTRAADFRALGATSLYLFGSAARGEAREDSDVDLFVDYDPDRFSFVELIRLHDRVTQILGRPADLTTREGLHPLLRSQIEAGAIRVF